MSNENGTRLARQVRRFIEKNPTAKSLENVTEDAKRMISKIGNTDYFEDESEKFDECPPEFMMKRALESRYKRLQKEYPNLPDLRGKATRIENIKNTTGDEAKEKADDEARKAREAADDEAKKKAEDERKAWQAADDEARKKADDETKISGLRDKPKSMGPEQLQDLLQDLEIPRSGRGSRETTADTSSSWNTRGSSVDPTSSDSGHWRKVRETLGEDSEYWLNKLSEISKENDCDFADVKFYLEYLLRQDPDREAPDLGGLALDFIDERPASQAQFVKELRDRDPQLYRAYNAYYASSWISGEKKERRPWARNPQAYRDQMFEDKKNVKGRI